jgi:DinB superfamily
VTDAPRLLAEAGHELARLPGALDAMLGGLDAETARTRPAAAEWAPVEIVCHLRDEETEDFRARLQHLQGGGRAFSRIDPARWAEERRYLEADLFRELAELKRRRATSLDFLASLDPRSLSAAAPLGSLGNLSGLDLVAAWVAHDRLHLAQLTATLANLWARRWTPLKSAYAGPIPYCEP